MESAFDTGEIDKVAIMDAGAQYSKVIDRKIRELDVYTDIIELDTPFSEIKKAGYKALIISGSPGSIYDDEAPTADPEIFSSKIPILGICYGHQMIAANFGGKVKKSDRREDGQFPISLDVSSPLFKNLASKEMVLLTHGDSCESVGPDFSVIATSDSIIAAIACPEKKIYGVQFHPEVDLTVNGKKIFENFLFDICKISPNFKMKSRMDKCIQDIREKVGNKKILMLMSGGVDSTVCCTLLHKALGPEKVIAVHIDNGFMRKNESTLVMDALAAIGLKVRLINAQLRFGAGTTTHKVKVDGGDQIRNIPIGPLNLVTLNPEEKRKIIGDTFMQIVKELWQELVQDGSDDILLGQEMLVIAGDEKLVRDMRGFNSLFCV